MSPGLFGVDQWYWSTQTPRLLYGRLIGPSDVVARKTVLRTCQDVVKYLFRTPNPVGETIRVGNLSFEVVGVLGGIQNTDIRRSIFIPISDSAEPISRSYWIREIYLRWTTTTRWNELGLWLLRRFRGLIEGTKQVSRCFITLSESEGDRRFMYKNIFIYAALSVTILLGGLGITNVMLAAVQDRTREIGLRKALGAKEKIIMAQFLTESVLISHFAGAIGAIGGLMSVQILKGPLGVEVSPKLMAASILGGLIFTVFLCVVSGLYPSIRASRLDSVSAMKFE